MDTPIDLTKNFSFWGKQLRADVATTFEEWVNMGDFLMGLEDNLPFYIGDWLKIGEDRFPDRYAQAAELTGKTIDTLRDYVWVASNVPPQNRRPGLSYNHHKAVAKLPSTEQVDWLRRAEEEEMSVKKMRRAIKVGQGEGTITPVMLSGSQFDLPNKSVDLIITDRVDPYGWGELFRVCKTHLFFLSSIEVIDGILSHPLDFIREQEWFEVRKELTIMYQPNMRLYWLTTAPLRNIPDEEWFITRDELHLKCLEVIPKGSIVLEPRHGVSNWIKDAAQAGYDCRQVVLS